MSNADPHPEIVALAKARWNREEDRAVDEDGRQYDPREEWEQIPQSWRNVYLEDAKADYRHILASLREPSEAMVMEGRRVNGLVDGNCLGLQYVAPEPAWQAMTAARARELGIEI